MICNRNTVELQIYASLELRVQRRHIVVPLGLEHVARHGRAQSVLGGKSTRIEMRPISVRALQHRLAELVRLLLLEQHEDVAMLAAARRRTGAHVLGQCIASGHIAAGHVDDSPVLPFASRRLFTRWRIRIGHDKRVETVCVSGRPVYDGRVFHLAGRQGLAEAHVDVIRVGDLCVKTGLDIYVCNS